MNRKDEIAFLTEQLTMVEHVDNDNIAPAIKAGLTIKVLEWNQRLGRSYDFVPTDAKAETAARIQWLVDNGVDPEVAPASAAALS